VNVLEVHLWAADIMLIVASNIFEFLTKVTRTTWDLLHSTIAWANDARKGVKGVLELGLSQDVLGATQDSTRGMGGHLKWHVE